MAASAAKNLINADPQWIGQKFGDYTIIKISPGPNRGVAWLCKCDCGNENFCQPSVIRQNKQLHCRSCAARKRKEALAPKIGQRFGRLTVIERKKGGRWLCQCDCGGQTTRKPSEMKKSTLAGCNNCARERNNLAVLKHGDSRSGGSKLYRIWHGMNNRCFKPEIKAYRYYGAKGIVVCEIWREYKAFKEWAIQVGYKEGLSIDRINPRGNYEPNNCEWVTRSENCRRVTHPQHLFLENRENYILAQLGMVA